MTFEELKKLTAGRSVAYKMAGIAEPVDCLVIQNGPRLDLEGKPITYLPDVLIIQIGAGPAQVSWEPINWPDGILELAASTDSLPSKPNQPGQPA